MSQTTKTVVFAGLAILSAALAFATRTGPVGVAPPDQVGKPLFEQFSDPLVAKSLKIVRFDEDLANLREIEIKEVDGIWTLPSHQGYPADAENRIRDAATPFVSDLMTVIRVVTDEEGEHALYGVVEPSAEGSDVGDQGVGTLVTIKDAAGDNLVNLVIGKEAGEGQRYVRPAGEPKHSRVYVVKIDPEALPVRFDDWIDKDLLNISAWDIERLTLKDYTFQVAQTLRGPITDFEQRLEITVSDDNGTWTLDSLMEDRDGNLTPTELLEGEELNQERLNGLKSALDELEIVDVERKPSGLGEDLKADKGFFNDQGAVDSLAKRGIYAVELPNGVAELLSTDGEVLVDTKDGVQYVLRFGQVAGVDADAIDEAGLNRYLLVSARLNEAKFPEPELESLPELPPTLSDDQVDSADKASADSPATDESGEPDEVDAESTETSEATDADADAATDDTAAATDEIDAAENGDAEVEEEFSDEAASEGDETSAETSQTKEEIQAERERINKENQRKIDERNDNMKKAEEKVREANYRFADWYYVISDDVYKKIHLGRSDIIQPTEEAKEQGFGVDALRNLEDGGLLRENEATETP
jgi:hypothetical protein